MATAKKVASGSKKVVSSKPSLRKEVVASSKKAPKKIVTRNIKQKGMQVPIFDRVKKSKTKTSVSKVPSIPLESKTSKDNPLKKVSGALHKHQSQLSDTITSLALLSPYRFPVNAHAVATGVARFGGLSLVIIGGLFTLFFAQTSFDVHAQRASVLLAMEGSLGDTITTITSSLTGGSTNSGSGSGSSNSSGNSSQGSSSNVNCLDLSQFTNTLCAALVNHTPSATFSLSANSPLKESVKIQIAVPSATAVTLSAYNTTQHQEYQIGSMGSSNSNSTWSINWDTNSFPDGVYTLKALVTNFYGTYEQLNPASLTVTNHPVVIATTTSTQQAVTQSSATTNSSDTSNPNSNTSVASSTASNSTSTSVAKATDVTTSKNVVLTSDKTTSSSDFLFQIATQNATNVMIYAYQKSTSKSILLGYAYKSATAVWNYKWNLGGYSDGEYVIAAIAVTTSGQSQSNTITVSKKSSSLLASTTASLLTVPAAVSSTTLKTVTQQPQVNPPVTIATQQNSPLSKIVDVKVTVSGASSIELYAQKRYSLIRSYLGKASLVDTNVWLYKWDTTQSPNAEYTLVAVVKNSYGSYEGQSNFVTVQNDVSTPLTQTQTDQIQKLQSVATEVQKTIASSSSAATGTVVVEKDQAVVSAAIDPYKDQIQANLDKLASALQSNNQDAIAAAKTDIQNLKVNILQSTPGLSESQSSAAQIDELINHQVTRVNTAVQLTNKLIVERTGQNASLDSDGDGITDYDEVNIYHTNPYNADTDGDGATDGAEVLAGTDPLVASTQKPVVYESPKDAGIVREDILKVTSVITAKPNTDTVASTTPVAIISGKALPDSFVTLYIFSTPIVVTIKADQNGNWNYRFDKELDDGKHQVYVGLTDNSGTIVAKSTPFNFVKVAQAYNADTNPEVSAATAAPEKGASLFSQYMIYLVLSISIVAIGLVLIMLGLHLEANAKKEGALLEEGEAVV